MDLVGLGNGHAHCPPQALPDGRERRRMGLRRPVSGADDAKTPRSGATTCARSSTPCAGSCAPGRPGGCCRRTSRRGRRSTSRPGAGWTPACFETMVARSAHAAAGADGADAATTAVILDSRTVQSTPESGAAGRVRRAQEAQGPQDPRRRRYAGAPAGAASSPRPTRRTAPRSRRWRRRCSR